jgi:hypothetical protein
MRASTQRRLRQLHNWTGVFFAPAIFFFAFTGLLQTIGLQDRRGSYIPPAWIATVANLHKHQMATMPHRPDRPRPAAAPAVAHDDHDDHDHEGGGRFSLLKPFVLLLSIALMATTMLGVWVALANRATRRTTWLLLAAGVVVPLALMLA